MSGNQEKGRFVGDSGRFTIEDLALTVPAPETGEVSARHFFAAWFQLFRTAQIHAIDNQALRRAMGRFVEVANALLEREGQLSFQAKNRALFLNRVKLRLSSDDFALADDVFAFFEARDMGGFVVEGPLDLSTVRRLLEILVYVSPEGRRFESLRQELDDSGVPVRINRTLGTRAVDGSAAMERRLYAFVTYSKLIVLYRTLIADSEVHPMKRRFLMRKTTRTVQSLVDICLEDDHTFLGVTAIKPAEAYAPHHAVNTAVLAITLGAVIGLRKVDLADLGMAALFRDVGLREVPPELLDKKGPLAPQERAAMERHPLTSVEFLLDEASFTRGLLRRIVVAFEHHAELDGGGYPVLERHPHLFSRIVAIADTYDALTTARPWRPAYLPDEALGVITAEAGKRFDPTLVKVFVNTLGIYPAGTLVRLDTGELGLVVHSAADGERAARPVVSLLEGGRPGRTVDLLERDEAGEFLRSIASAEDRAPLRARPDGAGGRREEPLSEPRDRLESMLEAVNAAPTERSSSGAAPVAAGRSRALLYASGSAIARGYLAVLETEGYDVLVATEPGAAETLLQSAPPQLLLAVCPTLDPALRERWQRLAPDAAIVEVPSLAALLEQQTVPSRPLLDFAVRTMAALVGALGAREGIPPERAATTLRLAEAAAEELGLGAWQRATVRLEAVLRHAPRLLSQELSPESDAQPMTETGEPGHERPLLGELARSLGSPFPLGGPTAATADGELPAASAIVAAAEHMVLLLERDDPNPALALRRLAREPGRTGSLHPAAVEGVLAAHGRAAPRRRGRILLVDPDAAPRSLLALRLRNEGFHVETTGDGRRALQIARDSPPDLILSEVVLPRLDGFSLLERLAREGLRDLPFVFLSHRSDPLSMNKGLLLGAADFLTKPIDSEVLLTRLQKHMAQPWEPGDASARLLLSAEMDADDGTGYGELVPGVRLLGRFRLERSLGEGGMGKVFRARDERLEEDVVLKVMKPELSGDSVLLRRFQREIRLARKISHPGVVRIYDFFESGRLKFLTMEYLEGTQLKAELRRRGAFPLPVALRIGQELLEALEAAHAVGVLHRDVKPQNVLMLTSGRIKVLDFGIAQALEPEGVEGATQGSAVPGTLEYMSPEQVAGESLDPRTDLYSGGLVIYEVLTGEPAFRGSSRLGTARQRLTVEPPPPSQSNPKVPPAVDSVILRLLARDRERRYRTAGEALAELRRLRR